MGSPKVRGKCSEIVKIAHRNEGIDMNVSETQKYMGQFTIYNNINRQFKVFYHVSEVRFGSCFGLGTPHFSLGNPPIF